MRRLKVAVVGGGWAGLSAAVHAVSGGHQVTLFEMSAQVGGRARTLAAETLPLDNGQHILIGAYRDTLALMRRVGVDTEAVLQRMPLALIYPDGNGLRLPPGPAMPAFARAVIGWQSWSWRQRLAVLTAASRWVLNGFRCDPNWTVARLAQGLPHRVIDELIEPLCVAALNTPASDASATVFLRVLKDALFSGPGAADLLLPRQTLSALLPEPAVEWLRQAGAQVVAGQRVQTLARNGDGWHVDGRDMDAVILACSATEAARLAQAASPRWAERAGGFAYEPILTVYLRSEGSRLPAPMVALRTDRRSPAQFAFDHGALGATPGLFAFVVSGAGPLLTHGLDSATQACLAQAHHAFPPGTWRQTPSVVRSIAERRATFRCTPGLGRPAMQIAPGLLACGDYVEGPYPATLEGAVRSGLAAAAAL